ncbi:hypothetical protein PtB15_1B172 [Puccinia triticina]|nr:hypothetical protein PtB15_1B172 [Puccinia triticina]
MTLLHGPAIGPIHSKLGNTPSPAHLVDINHCWLSSIALIPISSDRRFCGTNHQPDWKVRGMGGASESSTGMALCRWSWRHQHAS